MLKRFRSFWDVMLLSCRNKCHKRHCESASDRCGNLSLREHETLRPSRQTQGDMVPVVVRTKIDDL